eukprot:scaffold69567_cov19-Tisochrysis_lutea.AAC.1
MLHNCRKARSSITSAPGGLLRSLQRAMEWETLLPPFFSRAVLVCDIVMLVAPASTAIFVINVTVCVIWNRVVVE